MSLKKPKQKAPKNGAPTKKQTMAARAEKKAAKRAIKKELATFAPEAPVVPKEKPAISPLAEMIVKIADMKKAMNIVHLCVKDSSSITDDVIIMTGSSTPHLKALTGHLERDVLEQLNVKLRAVDGRADTGWILLDFGNAIVHIFTEDVRSFYDLERHFAHSPTLDTLAKIHEKMSQEQTTTKRVTLESLMKSKSATKTPTKRVTAKKTKTDEEKPVAVKKKAVAKTEKKVVEKSTPKPKTVAKKTPSAKAPSPKKSTTAKKEKE